MKQKQENTESHMRKYPNQDIEIRVYDIAGSCERLPEPLKCW